jgi:RND family efflux transporter MFP subunit
MNGRTFLAAFAAVVATFACKGKEAAEHEPAAVVNAQTVIVSTQAFTETFGAIGSVVTRAGHVATLSAPAAGRVGQVLVTPGQAVRQGQALVELDQAPFQAALDAAQAAYVAAERANARQQRLANEGIAPRKDAEAAAAEMARARAEVVTAQRAAALAVIKSPINGVVTRMSATLGASVDPAQWLVEVADPTSLDILMNATPTDAGRVRPGAKVTLTAGTAATGELLGVGTVVDIGAMVDSTLRGVPIRVQAPTTRRALKIGETVFGAVAVGMRPAAVVIPNDALVPDGENFKVFVVDAAGIAHEREVKLGGKSEAGTEIVEGLTAGERIVTQGAYAVSDSAKVQPLTPATTAKPAPPAAKEKP